MKPSKFTVTMMLAGLVLGAHGAYADEYDSDFYTGATADIAFAGKSDVTGATTGFQKYSFNSGVDMVLGWEPDALKTPGVGDVRLELQGGYHAFGLDAVKAGIVTNTNPDGDMKALTGMANIYYDFDTGSAFTPFIGAGAGIAHVTIPKGNGLGNTGGADDRFAYQGMLGVAYTSPAMPQTDWTIDYRYLALDGPSFQTAGGDIKIDNVSASALEAGFRYHF